VSFETREPKSLTAAFQLQADQSKFGVALKAEFGDGVGHGIVMSALTADEREDG